MKITIEVFENGDLTIDTGEEDLDVAMVSFLLQLANTKLLLSTIAEAKKGTLKVVKE